MSGFGQNQFGQQGGYSTNGTNGYGGAYGQGGFQQQNPFAQGGMFSRSFGGEGNGPQQGVRMNPGAYGNPYADQLQQGSGSVGQQPGASESNSSGLAMNGGSGGGLSNYLSGATYGGGQGPGHPTTGPVGVPGTDLPWQPSTGGGDPQSGFGGGAQTGGNMLYPGGQVPGDLANRNPSMQPYQGGGVWGTPMSGGASGGGNPYAISDRPLSGFGGGPGNPTMGNPLSGFTGTDTPYGGGMQPPHGDPMSFLNPTNSPGFTKGYTADPSTYPQMGTNGPGNPTTSQGMYNRQSGLGFPSIWQGMGYK